MALRGSNGGRSPKRTQGVTGEIRGHPDADHARGARRAGFADVAIYRSFAVVWKSPAPISNALLQDVDEPKQKCTMLAFRVVAW